jgi:hypothetical protein
MPRFILVETRALISWALRCFITGQSWHNWPRRFLRKFEAQVPKNKFKILLTVWPQLCHNGSRAAKAIDSFLTGSVTSPSGKHKNSAIEDRKVHTKRRDTKTSRQLEPPAQIALGVMTAPPKTWRVPVFIRQRSPKSNQEVQQ